MIIAQDKILGKQPKNNPEPQRGGTKLASQWTPDLTRLRYSLRGPPLL